MSRQRSIKAKALVLHTRNLGEADRMIVLLTQNLGKIRVVAKGVRRPHAKAGGSLEPGNLVECLLIQTKSWSILTQTKLVADTAQIRENLKAVKQLFQLLEMIDAMFVEEEIEQQLFDHVLKLRQMVITRQPRSQILQHMTQLVVRLGFIPPDLTQTTFAKYIEELVGRKMKSFDYLTVSKI